jgi:hypothetical protein
MMNQRNRLIVIFYLFFFLLVFDYLEFLTKAINFYYFHVFRLFITSLVVASFGYFLNLKRLALLLMLVVSTVLFLLSYLFVWNY